MIDYWKSLTILPESLAAAGSRHPAKFSTIIMRERPEGLCVQAAYTSTTINQLDLIKLVYVKHKPIADDAHVIIRSSRSC